MVAKRSIPPYLESEIKEQSAKNMTIDQIVESVKTNHNVTISRSAMGRFLTSVRAERKEQTKQAYQKAIVEAAPKDMAIIDESVNMLHGLRLKAYEEGNLSDFRGLTRDLMQHAAFRASLSGMSKDAESGSGDSEAMKEDLYEMLQRFDKESGKKD
jgi:hypothetical protein